MNSKTVNSVSKGKWAEDQAIQYLLQREHRFLRRNFYRRGGEIDLIMQDLVTAEIVFVEVKSSRVSEIDPAINLSPQKWHKLSRVIDHYCSEHQLDNFRFDLITLQADHRIEWWRNLET